MQRARRGVIALDFLGAVLFVLGATVAAVLGAVAWWWPLLGLVYLVTFVPETRRELGRLRDRLSL